MVARSSAVAVKGGELLLDALGAGRALLGVVQLIGVFPGVAGLIVLAECSMILGEAVQDVSLPGAAASAWLQAKGIFEELSDPRAEEIAAVLKEM